MTQKKSSEVKRKALKPAMAKDVLKAITDLYNSHGFPVKEILDQMERNANAESQIGMKNVSKQVLLAIKYGIQVGVLKQRIGRIYFTFTLQRNTNSQANTNNKLSKNKRANRKALKKRKIAKKNIGAGDGHVVKIQELDGWQRINPLWVEPNSVIFQDVQNEIINLDEYDDPEKNINK